MEHVPVRSSERATLSVEVDAELAASVAALNVDVAEVTSRALADAVKEERGRQWREENREAIQGWNTWIAKNGLPLERYRMF